MDYYLFQVTISTIAFGELIEDGVLIADNEVEAVQKLKLYYGDSLKEVKVKFYSDEGICILSPTPEHDELWSDLVKDMPGRTYTVKAEDIC